MERDDASSAQRTVIVTGGSRGIGAATCRLLAQDGWDVCVNYRENHSAAESVVADIIASGGRAVAVKADVAEEAEVIRLFEEAERELGPISGVVCNAGIIGPRCRVDELTMADIERVLHTNTVSAMICCREAVKRMSTRHGGAGGAIVLVSSGSAYIGSPALYAVSKGGINSLLAGLAIEVGGEGIRVNGVMPGLTATDMIPPDVLVSAVGRIPLGRAADPAEIGEAIVWLMSDRASYVVGENMRVGGGRPCRP
eukprot:m.28709 g.28709  ORF g.28709 m.28709 type:complete len:254 (+) comp5006_c0_seq2:363-1124(+)